ncbi:unnamed protein product [Withania somnifera]
MEMSAKLSTFVVLMVLPVAPSSLAQNLATDIVLVHNKARAEVAECTLVHSDSPYGENLAMGYGDFSAVEAVNLWVGEKPNYHYASNSCRDRMCGHYTQVVSKDTIQVGCARLKCANGEWWFVS